ncbi:PiggyBac transposable element-derived protein 5 [Armadillidium vulgare]|nr:PiggyBac transposable element-derived protein 5 [Armadillidium vulgare]
MDQAGSPEKFTGENKAKFETLGKTMPEIFYEIFPDSIFELMVKSTNAYAKKFLSDKKDNIKKSSRYNAWYDVTIQEMRQFLGLYILMGIIHKPTINSYWATDKYLSTPTFPSVMKRDRCFRNYRFF